MLATLITVSSVIAHLARESSVNDPNMVNPAWWTVALVIAGAMPLPRRQLEVGQWAMPVPVLARRSMM